MARLPAGMFKRGNAYYIRARIEGCLRSRSLGTDFAEATRLYRLILAKGGFAAILKAGQMPSRITVDVIARQWLAEYVANRRNAKGQRLTETRYGLYVSPAIGDMKAEKVKPEHLRRLCNTLLDSSLAPRTVAHIMADVRCMFRYAAGELQIIPRSPVPPRLLPKLERDVPRPHSDEDISAVIQGVDPGYSTVIRFVLMTGLRWGEVKGLRWSKVDFTAKKLQIVKTKTCVARRVPMIPQVVDLLRQCTPATSGRPVFPWLSARPDMFNYHVRKQSGVKVFSFHRLRHTFACRYLAAGGTLESLQKILGHADIRTTQIYAELYERHISKEMESIAVSIAVSISPPKLKVVGGDDESP